MFDKDAEFQRAGNIIQHMMDISAQKFDPRNPSTSFTVASMCNYLLGVTDVLDHINSDTPLDYPEDAVRGLIAIRQDQITNPTPSVDVSASFNLQEEEDRARAYLALVSSQAPEVMAYFESDDRPEPGDLIPAATTMGILTGILTAFQAMRGETVLDYSELLPSFVPEDLTDND